MEASAATLGVAQIGRGGEDSYFPAQKAVLDDRATDLGARTRRQIAAGKV
jgi:hypothetical protein